MASWHFYFLMYQYISGCKGVLITGRLDVMAEINEINQSHLISHDLI